MTDGLYTSIDGLVKDKKDKASGYCFDKAWLESIKNLKPAKSNDSTENIQKIASNALDLKENQEIAIACAAIEIGEKLRLDSTLKQSLWGGEYKLCWKYAADSGVVQNGMYKELMKIYELAHNCSNCPGNCDGFSRDVMTNFLFVVNTIIAILENDHRLQNPCHWYTKDVGGERYASESFFTRGYSVLMSDFKQATSREAKSLKESLRAFAQNSATLGNYECIPLKMQNVERKDRSCNKGKGSGGVYVEVEIAGKGEWLSANDQFAVFVDWLQCNTAFNEEDMVETWKKVMLIDCCEGYYKQASWYYKRTFLTLTQKERLEAFTQYLKLVNAAIELRSEQIVKRIQGIDRSCSSIARVTK